MRDDERKRVTHLTGVSGVHHELAGRLQDAGYGYLDEVADADEDDLTDVKGIGPKLASRIKRLATRATDKQDNSEDDG